MNKTRGIGETGESVAAKGEACQSVQIQRSKAAVVDEREYDSESVKKEHCSQVLHIDFILAAWKSGRSKKFCEQKCFIIHYNREMKESNSIPSAHGENQFSPDISRARSKHTKDLRCRW